MDSIAFHLAFPVTDLQATRDFYVSLLGCTEGRSAERWIDFDFFGHQVSAHLVGQIEASSATNEVDGKSIPVRHFGAILNWDDWHRLKAGIQAQAVDFLVEPHVRFAGQAGDQKANDHVEEHSPCGGVDRPRPPAPRQSLSGNLLP